DRLAATLNSPPLTWRSQCVALRNGTMPGSNRCTSAPSDTKSSAPFLGIFKPVFISFSRYDWQKRCLLSIGYWLSASFRENVQLSTFNVQPAERSAVASFPRLKVDS